VLVSTVPRQVTCQHRQAYWLSAKKTPSIEKVFLITNQKLALADCSVQEEFAFLENNSLPCIRYVGLVLVFLQTSFSPSRAQRCSFPTNRSPRCRCYSTSATPRVFYCVPLIVNKSLGYTFPDRPIVGVVSDLLLSLSYSLCNLLCFNRASIFSFEVSNS
jgi:hypothetical protein